MRANRGAVQGAVRRLIPIFGDQLSHDLPPVQDSDPAQDHIVMMEVGAEATSVPHHPQKIALIFSAMRHFADELRARGWRVRYIPYAKNTDFDQGIKQTIADLSPKELHMARASEWRVYQMQQGWAGALGLPVHIYDDPRFFASLDAFATWATGRKELRMEFFYRQLRRQTGLLMDGKNPVGGKWNFDAENRKKLPRGLAGPPRLALPPDAITAEVLDLVAREFPDHFGRLDGFSWPVTRAQALNALDHFIADCLPLFGAYQDAMRRGVYGQDDTLFHSLLAPALNLGLLNAQEVCQAAETAYDSGHAPLNAVEGFIRQILGWREYVRGLYWFMGPDYGPTNALNAHAPLPPSFWGGQTAMTCLGETVRATRDLAYAHHIQRLMITGNFALLFGLNPRAVNDWYLSVYADAFEWVQLPNTHGMALYADGGILASKPYAASGKYIQRMSDYCDSCAYDPQQTVGPGACPFNAAYWAFLDKNRDLLGSNPRMALIYANWDRRPAGDRAAILDWAAQQKSQINAL